MQGDPHGPPSSQTCVSVESDEMSLEQYLSQIRVLVETPLPQVTLQDDQSDHSVNSAAQSCTLQDRISIRSSGIASEHMPPSH